MTFEEIWEREGWFSEDTAEYELAKACYKAGEDEARAAAKPFTPDWSLLEATQASLREHMAALKAAQESEQRFREQVAATFAELRADFTKARDLHSAAAADKDYEGDAETGMRLSAAAVSWQDAVNRLDATIAALGLGGTEEAK